jgi:hypothetical protein
MVGFVKRLISSKFKVQSSGFVSPEVELFNG